MSSSPAPLRAPRSRDGGADPQGVDPGLRSTGFGIIDRAGQRLAYVTSGCIRTPRIESLPSASPSFSSRWPRWSPRPTARPRWRYEKVFVNANPASTLALGQRARDGDLRRRVGEAAGGEHTALPPGQAGGRGERARAQGAGAGHGDAAPAAPRHAYDADAADALACAICHAHGGQGLGAMTSPRVTGSGAGGSSAVRRARRERSPDDRTHPGYASRRIHRRSWSSAPGSATRSRCRWSTFYNLPVTGERVTLLTHLVVREDAHLLYGFGSDSERRAFRQLLKISGVGARTALAVLSGLSVGELAEAVTLQETGRLTRVPGIGKKTRRAPAPRAEGQAPGRARRREHAEPPRAGVERRAARAAVARLQREGGGRGGETGAGRARRRGGHPARPEVPVQRLEGPVPKGTYEVTRAE